MANTLAQPVITSKAYRLIEPGVFQETELVHEIKNGEVVVKPEMASICHADLRYFSGNRRQEALEKKLPMALFHEGIGKIVYAKDPTMEGKRVAIIPNISGYAQRQQNKYNCCPPCQRGVEDNYCENAVFLGSGYDGIGQSRLVLPKENVIFIPDSISDEFAVLAELCSVSLHAVSNVSDFLHEGKAAVFGDGPVGYLTAAVLHHVYNIPKENLIVFGAVEEKLAHFDFATTKLIFDVDFKAMRNVVHVFECTGGAFSENAINQAIDLLEPRGALTLMGVTENRVPINTRDILEKGLRLYGSSRSSRKEFEQLMASFQNKAFQACLAKLLPEKPTIIETVEDLTRAMNETLEHKGWKKTLLSFQWDE
ncbi:alcohol dehydrogenase catalytic domain-containing protein [Virgibacillus sp. 179-BFC.A HS]|uniref:Alcohol dehydrogenase catalytic domain-containing protein n=1 Tax=Tigheibacillus jepli TaxID=3035914 RepID=A0ABU5CFM1_9BACI|nr:alcohol dehydrogenase catalytic domain-containing protein [Virgibacillus sp. 179-BFC.A HS]MDY0404639.1 alcohol dehydrogenase catalytic domain-containing protein [Virgibacillus sp. 179-BFC.A HS]